MTKYLSNLPATQYAIINYLYILFGTPRKRSRGPLALVVFLRQLMFLWPVFEGEKLSSVLKIKCAGLVELDSSGTSLFSQLVEILEGSTILLFSFVDMSPNMKGIQVEPWRNEISSFVVHHLFSFRSRYFLFVGDYNMSFSMTR